MFYDVIGKLYSEPLVDVRKYGAVADGITDNFNALNRAFKNERCVYIPAGVFATSKTIEIPDNTLVVGAGFTSIIKLMHPFSLTAYPWRTTQKYPIVYVNANCTLKDFLVNGDETEAEDHGQVGIWVHGDNTTLINVATKNINYFPDDWIGGTRGYGTINAPGYSIFISQCRNIQIVGCSTDGSGYEGIGTEHAENVIINGCCVGDGNRTGIQIHRGSKHVVVSDCIVDNHCENKLTDITIHGENTDTDYIEDLKIIGCSCVYPSNGEYGIQTVTGREKGVVIESCRITANTIGIITANDMEETVQNSQNLVITGNIIDSEGDGIEVRGNKCVICNNIIHCSGTPITVTGEDKVIDNNLLIEEPAE